MNTYPEMDAKIVGILRLGDEPAHLYAAQRIEELEGVLETIGGADKASLARKLRRVNAENRALRIERDEARRANERLRSALQACDCEYCLLDEERTDAPAAASPASEGEDTGGMG